MYICLVIAIMNPYFVSYSSFPISLSEYYFVYSPNTNELYICNSSMYLRRGSQEFERLTVIVISILSISVKFLNFEDINNIPEKYIISV